MVSSIKLIPAVLALVVSISAQKVLQTLPSMELSFYYDNSVARGDPDKCMEHSQNAMWQGGAYLDNRGACGGPSYNQMGHDRAVALGEGLFSTGLCGHHIRLTSPEGVVYKHDQGDLYVKDRCGICGTSRVDVSGYVLKRICGGECGIRGPTNSLQDPKGWKVEILDTVEPGAQYNTDPNGGPLPSEGAGAPPAPAPAPIPKPSAPGPPPAAGSCTCNAKGVSGCRNGVSLICQPADGADYTKFMWVEQPGQACSVSCNA